MHTSSPLVIILLGAPGSGKGTQATLLKEQLNLPHISTGDLLRQHIRHKTTTGALAQQFIDQGQLVPDDLIMDMLFTRLQESDCAKGYILDGFPRTLPQAQKLETFLTALSIRPLVINLSLSDSIIIERLSLRVSCPQCGKPYHLLYAPPVKPHVCDSCSQTLTQRLDDSKEIVLKRLQVYQKQTAPLIDFYHNRNQLHAVDCSASKEEVFAKILSLL